LSDENAEKNLCKIYKGKVPQVLIKSAQISNKKATFITNLELF
jgi:hypothetical protein